MSTSHSKNILLHDSPHFLCICGLGSLFYNVHPSLRMWVSTGKASIWCSAKRQIHSAAFPQHRKSFSSPFWLCGSSYHRILSGGNLAGCNSSCSHCNIFCQISKSTHVNLPPLPDLRLPCRKCIIFHAFRRKFSFSIHPADRLNTFADTFWYYSAGEDRRNVTIHFHRSCL